MSVKIDKNKCIYCGACVAVCPVLALKLKEILVEWDKNKCIRCGKCAKACPSGAISLSEE